MIKISQNLKNSVPPTLLIAGALIIRILYYFFSNGAVITPDSFSYVTRGHLMLSSLIFVDEWRTPLYPVITNIPFLLSGIDSANINSQDFISVLEIFTIFQIAVGIFTIVLLYYLLRLAGVKLVPAFLFTLFVAGDIYIFSYERAILTETLAIFLLLITTILIINILKNPKLIYFFLVFTCFILNFLLRPFSMLLPVVLGVIIWKYKKLSVTLLSGIICLVYVGIIAIYIQQNSVHHKFSGISRISDINMLGVIMKQKLALNQGLSKSGFYMRAEDYMSRHTDNANAWEFLNEYPEFYDISYSKQIALLNSATIRSNLPQYALRSLQTIPAALLDTNNYISWSRQHRPFEFFLKTIRVIYSYLQWFTFIVLFGYPVSLYYFLIRPSVKNAVIFLFGTLAMYHILLAVFLSYNDYARLIVPGRIYLFAFTWYCWYAFIKVVYERITKSKPGAIFSNE